VPKHLTTLATEELHRKRKLLTTVLTVTVILWALLLLSLVYLWVQKGPSLVTGIVLAVMVPAMLPAVAGRTAIDKELARRKQQV
jgi:Trk-type K+ transport system membrane component